MNWDIACVAGGIIGARIVAEELPSHGKKGKSRIEIHSKITEAVLDFFLKRWKCLLFTHLNHNKSLNQI